MKACRVHQRYVKKQNYQPIDIIAKLEFVFSGENFSRYYRL
jgi:hypothetical protein